MLKYSILIVYVVMVVVFPIYAVTVDTVSDGDRTSTVSDGDQAPTVSNGDQGFPLPITPDDDEADPEEVNPNDSESIIVESTIPEPIDTEPIIISVIVPENMDFTIDPYGVAGRGQIYSDEKKIQNKGNTDIRITFTDFEVHFSNEQEFDSLTESFAFSSEEGEAYERKAIFLTLDFGRSGVEPVILTGWNGEQPSVLLSAETIDPSNSYVNLTVGGNLNPKPATQWQDGDVSIRIAYHIEVFSADAQATE
jgi:hypothetical protein